MVGLGIRDPGWGTHGRAPGCASARGSRAVPGTLVCVGGDGQAETLTVAP